MALLKILRKIQTTTHAMDSFFVKLYTNEKIFKKWCPWSEFARSRVMRAKRASVVYVATCKVPTCQNPANYSTWRANLPKAWQLFNLACLACQGVPIFQLGTSTCQNGCQFFDFACQNMYQFFNYFSFLNFWVFQLCLTFQISRIFGQF